MPRGGRRTGTPGASYGQRTDLQVPMAAASGQQYGMRAEQMAAQRAIPIARPATDRVPGPAPEGATGAERVPAPVAPSVLPGQVTPLDAPTEHPDEPVTAGLPIGAGAGPEALGAFAPTQQYQSAKDFLSASLASSAGNREVAFLLAQLQSRGL